MYHITFIDRQDFQMFGKILILSKLKFTFDGSLKRISFDNKATKKIFELLKIYGLEDFEIKYETKFLG